MKDMKNWSSEEIRLHLEKVHDRIDNGEIISRVKEQTKLLCEFTQDFFVHQIIEHSTRKSNLLDLVFCNEEDLFPNQTIIENVLMSDHKIVILESNISLNSKKESESKEKFIKQLFLHIIYCWLKSQNGMY